MNSPTATLIPSDSAQIARLCHCHAGRAGQEKENAEPGGRYVDIAGAAAGGIARRTVLQTQELRVVLFDFAAGRELAAHSSPHRALVQVVEGACEFFFNGAWQRLEAGALLHLPPNHTHAARASLGAFSMLLTLGLAGAKAEAGRA